MSSWAKPSGTGRRPQPNPNGSAQPLRAYRRAAPYPSREDRPEERKDALDSYEELDQKHNYGGSVKYEGFKQQNAKGEGSSPADRRKALYQKFYRQVQEERKPAGCVVLSVTNQCTDYPKSIGQCLQERGLSVEMLYLQAESGLTRALQDIRADGTQLCILVEQTNIALCSCTVIIFSESLKIHRNMPKEQALDFVAADYRRRPVKEPRQRDPADIAAQASQLLDDFLDREKIERHAVPSETRQLLLLLAEGVHLYPDELGTISEYLRSRMDHKQASTTEGERGDMLPPGLGKPPPLLPTPPGPPQPQPGPGAGGLLPEPLIDHHHLSQPTPLLPSPGSYPKTKPPPLLSLHRAPGPSLGGPILRGLSPPRGPPPSHSLYGGPPSHGLLHHPGLPYFPGPRGPHGIRSIPPSLKSVRTPLLSLPGW